MYTRKKDSFNNENQWLESLPNSNQQQSRGYIRGGYGYDHFQPSHEMPLFRHPPPPSVPPPPPPPLPPQHLMVPDRNNSYHHSTVPPPPPPPPPPDNTSVGGSENPTHGWKVPDSTHQSYNQNIYPPIPQNNFPNTSLPPPPLSMYPTDTNQVPPTLPVKAPAIPYPRPQVPFVTSNPTCPPPPPPIPNTACPPPPPPPVVLSHQNNLTTKNSRNQLIPQPAVPPSFIHGSCSTPSDNLCSSRPVPSPQDMLSLPPNFNVPPPSLPVLNNSMTVQQNCQSVFNNEEKDKNEAANIQRQKDLSWIKQRFLKSNFGVPQSTSKKESITISEGQKLIRDLLILAAQLQQQTKNLESIMATASRDVWIEEIKKTEYMKERVELLHQKVDNENLMTQLVMKVKKRGKKRERLKRSRARCYQEKQEALARRNELHCKINEWRDAISQKEIQLKKDKEMKMCVDSVLSEVRKKKSDVSKMLEMIKALSKLRKIRKENVAKKGLYTLFHCDQKFEEDISRLQKMLNHQMEVYEAEQRTLMVMLECEQEETIERERAHSHKVQAEIEKREQKREQQLLFGKRTIESDDPVYPFMKFYSQAEDNWEAFIQIRRGWDSYLVPENTPGASRIPNTWVMPPEPSDALWAKFLET